jgi:hypothetical protein
MDENIKHLPHAIIVIVYLFSYWLINLKTLTTLLNLVVFYSSVYIIKLIKYDSEKVPGKSEYVLLCIFALFIGLYLLKKKNNVSQQTFKDKKKIQRLLVEQMMLLDNIPDGAIIYSIEKEEKTELIEEK